MRHSSRAQICLTVLIATAACSGKPRKAGDDALEQAGRYERGDWVARDFRRAAELLEKSCDQGRGNASACRRLAIARSRGRGVPKQGLVGALLRHACERGDWLACGFYAPFDEVKARAACDGKEPEACVALATLLVFSQSGTVELEHRELLARACQRSVLEGCLQLVELFGDRAAAEAPFALERVRAECTRGDVDACAAVGTPLPPSELCDAGDYQACATVGASGDGAALERACEASVLTACEQIAFRARDADPVDPRALQYLERACRLGSDVACLQSRATDLSTGCVAYDPHRIAADRRRQLPTIRGVDATGAPWKQTMDTALVVVTRQPKTTWETYAEITNRLRGSAEVVVVIHDRTDAAPAGVSLVRLDAAVGGEPVVTTAPGAALDVMDVRTSTRLGDPRIKIMDQQRRTLAILDGAVELSAATFVRCVRSVLAES